MRTIIVTVGTSLLSNARRILRVEEVTDRQLDQYLKETESEKASAETNSLGRLLQTGDRIVFLHSQTDEGRQCAEALRRHYTRQHYSVELREVRDLTYAESRFKLRGLRSLVATLIEQIRKERAQQRPVLINATGGFKAEIAYATLVGLLFDAPVYYIHEAFRDIIEMPPTPISWDYSLLADYEEFFEWVSQVHTTPEVDRRLRGLPGEIRLLLAEEAGFTFLSPAGEAFYEAFRQKEAEAQAIPIFLSEKARSTYRSLEPSVRQSFDRVLNKLRLAELRRTGSDQVRNSDCLVFPKGRRDERIFYFQDDEGRILVCELTRHSDKSYEQALDRGVKRDYYTGFQPWPER